ISTAEGTSLSLPCLTPLFPTAEGSFPASFPSLPAPRSQRECVIGSSPAARQGLQRRGSVERRAALLVGDGPGSVRAAKARRPRGGAAQAWAPPPRGPSHHTRGRRRRPERCRGAGHQERGEEALGDAVAALAEGARVVGRGDGDGRVEGVRKQEGKRDADCHARTQELADAMVEFGWLVFIRNM
ncbi:unnamed protein product, partial [Urochloa humidicola]